MTTNCLKSIFYRSLLQASNVTSLLSRNVCDIGVVGVPMARGQRKKGVEQGPEYIRKAGLMQELQSLGTTKDYGDLKFDDVADETKYRSIEHPKYMGSAIKTIATSVRNILSECNTCVNLGGDHSLGIGSIFGHASYNKDLAVLWIDAHADINTPRTSVTGSIHGMSASFLLDELKQDIEKVPGFEWLHSVITGKQIVYIGLRDVEDQEREILDELGIVTYSMREIDRYGIYAVIKRALHQVDPNNNRSLHVSFDIDSIDKCIVPSTGTSVIGGLNVREALCIAEELRATGRLKVLDLVEVNPKLGTEADISLTTEIATRVILGFFGKDRRGNLPKKIDSRTN